MPFTVSDKSILKEIIGLAEDTTRDSQNEMTPEYTGAIAKLGADIITHSDNKAPRPYPAVFFIAPKIKPASLYRLADKLHEKFSIFCMCEFQMVTEKTNEPIALWHPLEGMRKDIDNVSDLYRQLAPNIKAVYMAFKTGVIGAKMAGIDAPNMTAYIPTDYLDYGSSFISAFKDDSAAGLETKVAVQDDGELLRYIDGRRVGSARFRPTAMEQHASKEVQRLFGLLMVWCYPAVMGDVDMMMM